MSAPAIISSGTAAGGPPVGGTGNPNTIPRWTGPSTLGDSVITQSGTLIGVNKAIPTSTIDVDGLQTNSSVTSASAPTGTLRLNFAGQPTPGYGASIVFSQQWFAGSPTSYVAVGQITGVKTVAAGSYGGGVALWYNNGGNALVEGMRINDTGNVGIGTASPGASLHVRGGGGTINSILDSSTSGDTRTELRNNGTRAGYIYWDASEVRAFADTGRFLSFYAGASERARIDSAGNFGIGTASPQARAHIKAANAAFRGQLTVEGDGTLAQITLYNGGTTSTDLVGQLYTDSAGNPNFHISAYKNTGALYFETGTSNTLRWQINSSGHLLAGADNTYDIGASGATRPRTIYTGSDSYINSARVGLGSGNVSTNAVLGGGALGANTTGAYNTAVGYEALKANTDNSANTAVGYRALLTQGASAYQNTAIGAEALSANTTGVNNTALGRNAGNTTTTGQSNIFLGVNAVAGAAGDSNKLVVGSSTQWVATNGGATTYYATAGALAGYIIVRLNGADVKLPVYAL